MGHAHHFLSRLDRVSAPHVELALSLYRDHDLLGAILQAARVPDTYARVAISLAHPERGPFLVVTRDGHFVTCLGEGMAPTGLFVISREKLDGVITRTQHLRERVQLSRKLTADWSELDRLIARLYDAAERFSREELQALAAFQPLLAMEFFKLLIEASGEIDRTREFLLRQLRRADRLHRRHDELLHRFWRHVWLVGHLSVLVAMDGRTSFDALPGSLIEKLRRYSFSWPAVKQGVFGVAMRGVWGAARLGKMFLPAYKRDFAAATTYLDLVDAGVSLAAIGLRHSRLHHEVGKALAAGLRVADTDPDADALRKMATVLRQLFEMAQEDPERLRSTHRNSGADVALQLGKLVRPGSPYRFTRREDVPDALAFPLAVSQPAHYLRSPEALLAFGAMVPWVAHADAEDLYLPEAYLAEVRWSWNPELVTRLLLDFRDSFYREDEALPGEGPSRNGPCPCGSGKKYKRCCGADRD